MPEYVVHAAMLLLAMLGGVRGFAPTPNCLPSGADCDLGGDSAPASNLRLVALVAGAGAWDLNGGAGPWCDASQAPGRESASMHAAGDRGWDPCCFWNLCNIWDAAWDWNGPNPGAPGTWCGRADFDKNGGTCWNGQSWDFWTGGFLYDLCPCQAGDINCDAATSQKQMCIATSDNGVWWDWRQCYDWTQDSNCWDTLLEQKCHTDHSKDVCYNGFIQAPNGGGYSCAADFYSKVDDQGLLMCWPAP